MKTQSFEKEETFFPPEKLFRPFFSRIVEYKKAQGTFYRGLEINVTVFVQGIRSKLQDLRCR